MSLDIPFRGIMSIITRNHYIFMNHELKHLELTDGQVPCLLVLSKKEGITQDELAKMFYIDKGTIARAIKKLEEKGMVNKVQDPLNRRRYLLSLTQKGEQVIPVILQAEKKWENILFKGFSNEERSYMLNKMTILAENSLKSPIKPYKD
ncbi:MAG TPA: MarR family transcriptional regulator [Methanobacterium sp.]|jgi:DNA-binding MarR family transcriptional regulator|nr:MarR family transcriptional regulator [Methanobacterium sp.]HOI39973.1 MarR family transcriptional regulator [Methanobacterium sp.]